MRSDDEVRAVLSDHQMRTMAAVLDPARRAKLAADMKWTEERLVGYAEGIEFAYRWFLEGADG